MFFTLRVNFYNSFLDKYPFIGIKKINNKILTSSKKYYTDDELAQTNNAWCEILFSEIEKSENFNFCGMMIIGSRHIREPNSDSIERILNYFHFKPDIFFLDKLIS